MFHKGRKIPESSFSSLRAILQKMGWTMDVPFFNGDGTFPGAVIGERVFVESMMEAANEQENTNPSDEAQGTPQSKV